MLSAIDQMRDSVFVTKHTDDESMFRQGSIWSDDDDTGSRQASANRENGGGYLLSGQDA